MPKPGAIQTAYRAPRTTVRRVKNNVQSLTVCLLRSKAAESSPKVVSPASSFVEMGLCPPSPGWLLPVLTEILVLERGDGAVVVVLDDDDSKVLRPRKDTGVFLVVVEEKFRVKWEAAVAGRRRRERVDGDGRGVPSKRAERPDCIMSIY